MKDEIKVPNCFQSVLEGSRSSWQKSLKRKKTSTAMHGKQGTGEKDNFSEPEKNV